MSELTTMPELTTIPDVDTIAGLIKDLVAYVARQSPYLIDDAGLDTLGIDRLFILAGIQRCFGVQVPPSEIRTDIRTVGQLCQVLGTFVHGALRTRRPEPRPSAPRRLLIVGTGVPEHEQAFARRGWRATMLTHYDVAHEGPPVGVINGVIDQVEAADWARPFDVIGRIVDLYAAPHIERVVPVDEFALLPAALATTQLGIPGLSLRAVRNSRDKFHMRRVLEQAGLGQVRYAACHNLAQAQAFLDRVGGPIILKPVSGTGSDGVSLVASGEELASAFKLAAEADGFTGILCEEYIEGPEVSLEGYSVDGRFVPVALTDKLTDERFLEIGHQQPTSHPQSVFQAAADITGRALAALGVENGVSHTELRISTRGPVLIETHTRMGGDRLHVLTHLTTGVDLADLMVAFSLGEAVDARPEPQGRAAAIRFLVGRPGRVRGVRVPALQPGNGIHAVVVPTVGKALSGRSSSRERLGHVIATGPTPELAGRTAESFIEQIHIDYFDQI
ncbi:MAG TPA: ATP-grasp domain-containing protein [Terriglobia bacterium]|nr:ATP-grasp domain-containing protein [Terriglobia bacterium]